MKPDRNPVAPHQIHLAPVLGLCVSERVERGIRNHPEPGRIRISNYFCLGTYMPSTGELIDIERVTISLEGGRWKSTQRGNSLAAYPTACTVLNGGDEETGLCTNRA